MNVESSYQATGPSAHNNHFTLVERVAFLFCKWAIAFIFDINRLIETGGAICVRTLLSCLKTVSITGKDWARILSSSQT